MLKLKTLLVLMMGLLITTTHAKAQSPVVRAVLFYSPSCPHCHEVMDNHLPPLLLEYGEQLQILAVDVTLPSGQQLYQSAVEMFQIPRERLGVPNLTIGSTVLVGSVEIPTYLPNMIEQGLAAGGIDWPGIPGMDSLLASGLFSLMEAGGSTALSPTIWQRFAQDPAGNSLATIVLVAMVASVVYLWRLAGDARRRTGRAIPKWLIPGLSLAGLFVAAYLTYIEITAAEAVCGPIGDCNVVQQSPYAMLFGIIPIGVLGLVGYAAVLFIWARQTYGAGEKDLKATRTRWWLALGGTIFSIYLTFLEPFVIGATCAWCLASAVLMTALLWATTQEVLQETGKRKRRSAFG
jgi:uncharacterized membrane protein